MVVLWPLRKALTVSFNKHVGPVDTRSNIWHSTRRSYILERTGKIDIGRRSLLDFTVEFFGMALLRAVFQVEGKTCFEIQLFRM